MQNQNSAAGLPRGAWWESPDYCETPRGWLFRPAEVDPDTGKLEPGATFPMGYGMAIEQAGPRITIGWYLTYADRRPSDGQVLAHISIAPVAQGGARRWFKTVEEAQAYILAALEAGEGQQ